MAYQNPIPNLDDKVETFPLESESDYTPIEEVYFAFIDVLGFKKTFDDIKISQNKDDAEKYRDVFNYYFSLMNAAKFMEKGKSTGCYAGQTSDSLYFYTERTDYLMQFIKIFSHFNLYAMSRNVFFRGGIAKGSLYKKEKYQFYGDSVIGAYLLESDISKNPIIIIDEQTHCDMKGIKGYLDIIDIDNNQRYYIKPFEFLKKNNILDVDENFIVKEVNAAQVRKNIEDNRRAFEYSASNYAKYRFLLGELEKSNKNESNGIE